jgi:phenylpropionate dioxygenase-like ring-hydroxylating dioxygenase large terminal subunit
MVTTAMWLRNCWYVIAWDHEVPPADSPELFSRTVLGEPILVMRTEDKGIVAMEDRCCHRLAPLSKGRREGDCVRCGYHGLKFDSTGKCVDAPGIRIIPEKARVRTYPVAVHNKWVFVWMGAPAKADLKLLPDNYSCDHPDWKNKPGYLHYDTPYLLVCDNLLDFSHLSYVHANTLGGSTVIAEAPAKVEPVSQGIRVSRFVHDVPPSAFWKSFQSFDRNVDRYFVYDFVLPATLLMKSGGKPTGLADDDMTGGVELHSCQALTPETETTTHYFFQQSHRSYVNDERVTEIIFDGLVAAFEEDRDMITAQYQSILKNPSVPMLALGGDAAVVRFRSLLERSVQAELQAST